MKRASLADGMTLIEVIVVITIVGVTTTLTALAIPRVIERAPDDPARVLADARRRALRDGVAVVARVLVDSVMQEIVALPDGSIVADTGVAIEPLTARWRHAH